MELSSGLMVSWVREAWATKQQRNDRKRNIAPEIAQWTSGFESDLALSVSYVMISLFTRA